MRKSVHNYHHMDYPNSLGRKTVSASSILQSAHIQSLRLDLRRQRNSPVTHSQWPMHGESHVETDQANNDHP